MALPAAVASFLAQQKSYNDRQAKAIDEAVASVSGPTGLANDIDSLYAKIKELEDSAGTITPEDQALLDEALAQAGALATKAEETATALKNLDSLTPPVVPPPTA